MPSASNLFIFFPPPPWAMKLWAGICTSWLQYAWPKTHFHLLEGPTLGHGARSPGRFLVAALSGKGPIPRHRRQLAVSAPEGHFLPLCCVDRLLPLAVVWRREALPSLTCFQRAPWFGWGGPSLKPLPAALYHGGFSLSSPTVPVVAPLGFRVAAFGLFVLGSLCFCCLFVSLLSPPLPALLTVLGGLSCGRWGAVGCGPPCYPLLPTLLFIWVASCGSLDLFRCLL